MIHIAIILAFLCGTMFMATKIIDLLFAWLNITLKKEGIQSSKPEQITGKALDSLQLQEYSLLNYGSAANTCNVEAEVICRETIHSLEALSEGLQAAAESAVEHISAIIEGLSSS